jgi:hypothetical protein
VALEALGGDVLGAAGGVEDGLGERADAAADVEEVVAGTEIGRDGLDEGAEA